jgi:hypothetical protein
VNCASIEKLNAVWRKMILGKCSFSDSNQTEYSQAVAGAAEMASYVNIGNEKSPG